MDYATANNVCLNSGDKPLTEALQILNSEGVSSLVVVDNYLNVIGNISTTDVKVWVLCCSGTAFINELLATHPIIISSAASKHLYPFHLSHIINQGLK